MTLQLESEFLLDCDLLDAEMRGKISWFICVCVCVCARARVLVPKCELPVAYVCLWV